MDLEKIALMDKVDHFLIGVGFSGPDRDPNVIAVNGGRLVYSAPEHYAKIRFKSSSSGLSLPTLCEINFSYKFPNTQKEVKILCGVDLDLIGVFREGLGKLEDRSYSFYRYKSGFSIAFHKDFFRPTRRRCEHRPIGEGPSSLSYKDGADQRADLIESSYYVNGFYKEKRGYFFKAAPKKVVIPTLDSLMRDLLNGEDLLEALIKS